MNTRFVVVPAVYVFFLRNDGDARAVLLQLREGTGFMDGHWAAAAAGHIELGESVYEAAVREVTEELDVKVHPKDLVPLCAMQRRNPGSDDPLDQRVDYFLTTTRWAGGPRIREPDRCADLRWFPLVELPQPVVPHELRVLEMLATGQVTPVVTFGF